MLSSLTEADEQIVAVKKQANADAVTAAVKAKREMSSKGKVQVRCEEGCAAEGGWCAEGGSQWL
eukprot:596682-Prymnesium_polylepis.1